MIKNVYLSTIHKLNLLKQKNRVKKNKIKLAHH